MNIARLSVAFFLLPGCLIYRGSGILDEEARSVDEFDMISSTCSVEVLVVAGGDEDPEAIVECDDNLIEHIQTEVRGGELTVKTPNGVSISPKTTCQVTAYTASLHRGVNTGSGGLYVEGDLSGFNEGQNTGSGSVEILGFSSAAIELDNSGSGGVYAEGLADSADITNTGSGAIEARNVEVATAEIRNTGSGDIELTVSDSATVKITGSGDVELWGGASTDVTDSGSGDLVQH